MKSDVTKTAKIKNCISITENKATTEYSFLFVSDAKEFKYWVNCVYSAIGNCEPFSKIQLKTFRHQSPIHVVIIHWDNY